MVRENMQRKSTRKLTDSANEFDYSIKSVVIGDSGVGKTCILQRLANSKSSMKPTPTVDGIFHKQRVGIADDQVMQLSIWDTAGTEAFKSVTRVFYRGTSCGLLVYDLTKRATFESIPQWIDDLKQHSGNSKLVLMLVANKSDLESDRQVTAEEGADLARQYNMEYMETSAKTLDNIEQVFDVLSEQVYHNIKIGNLIPNAEVNGIRIGKTRPQVTAEAEKESKKCAC